VLSTATVIAIEGGTLSFPGYNASAAFAGGALPEDTLIAVDIYNPADMPPAPPGKRALTVMQIGPPELGPGNPVTVTLPWTLAELADSEPDMLEIARFIGGTWMSLGGATDEIAGTTSVTTTFGSPMVHPEVSLYALFAPSSVGGIAEAPPVESPAVAQPTGEQGSSRSPWVWPALIGALAGAVMLTFVMRQRIAQRSR
jgi:hypothetical protein